MITHDRLLKVLSYDASTGEFTWRIQLALRGKVGTKAGCVGQRGCIRIRIDCHLYLGHVLAWFYVYGEWPQAMIDHIDGRPTNNRIDNLRLANSFENAWNAAAHRDSRSGIKGVSFEAQRNKWRVNICAFGHVRFVGRFDRKEQAREAYLEASRKLHGSFSVANRSEAG